MNPRTAMWLQTPLQYPWKVFNSNCFSNDVFTACSVKSKISQLWNTSHRLVPHKIILSTSSAGKRGCNATCLEARVYKFERLPFSFLEKCSFKIHKIAWSCLSPSFITVDNSSPFFTFVIIVNCSKKKWLFLNMHNRTQRDVHLPAFDDKLSEYLILSSFLTPYDAVVISRTWPRLIFRVSQLKIIKTELIWIPKNWAIFLKNCRRIKLWSLFLFLETFFHCIFKLTLTFQLRNSQQQVLLAERRRM